MLNEVGGVGLASRRGVEAGNGANAGLLRRRKTLPGGRAVVGAFLVTLAAIGVFAAYTDATADTRERFLVAREDLSVGQRITAANLGHLSMDLPGLVRSRSFQDADDLIGAVVLGPLNKGELVQSSDVLLRRGVTPVGREVSFSIESARAVDGQLQRGELVDVLVTYGTGGDAYTVTVARGVRVVSRREPRGTLGDGKDEVITVSVPGSAETLALAHAVSAGTVTLVRTAGGEGGGPGGDTYRAPGAPSGASGAG